MKTENKDVVLIIGAGSAGQRHSALARKRGNEPLTVDPIQTATFVTSNELEALHSLSQDGRNVAYAVIASPPENHLIQAVTCVESGIPTLCEKPMGTSPTPAEDKLWHEIAIRTRVAYNYRFHPMINGTRIMALCDTIPQGQWGIKSIQRRKHWPDWGFLLDHLSHDVDILRYVTGEDIVFTKATHTLSRTIDRWHVTGETSSGDPVVISDVTTTLPVPKTATLQTPIENIRIFPSRTMFEDMTDAFLAVMDIPSPDGVSAQTEDFAPILATVEDGIAVHKDLRDIARLAGE